MPYKDPELQRAANRASYWRYRAERLTKNKAWYTTNRTRHLATTQKSRAARNADPTKYEARKERDRVRRRNNRKQVNERVAQRYATDLAHRMCCVLRARLRAALKHGYKAGSAVRDLGCSIPEFMTYIEAQFQDGMTWQNWGKSTWHLDHIKPLSSFDLTDIEQLREACHYTNIQPLWAKDNMAKGARQPA